MNSLVRLSMYTISAEVISEEPVYRYKYRVKFFQNHSVPDNSNEYGE